EAPLPSNRVRPSGRDSHDRACMKPGEVQDWAMRWGWDHELFCLSCVLCWSRWRTIWFTTSLDRQHTFEGLVRFFEAAGGVPRGVRIDRMGALGKSQRKRFTLFAPTVEFATHHQIEIVACEIRPRTWCT